MIPRLAHRSMSHEWTHFLSVVHGVLNERTLPQFRRAVRSIGGFATEIQLNGQTIKFGDRNNPSQHMRRYTQAAGAVVDLSQGYSVQKVLDFMQDSVQARRNTVFKVKVQGAGAAQKILAHINPSQTPALPGSQTFVSPASRRRALQFGSMALN